MKLNDKKVANTSKENKSVKSDGKKQTANGSKSSIKHPKHNNKQFNKKSTREATGNNAMADALAGLKIN